MDIQHHLNGRIFCQIALDGLPHTLVGAVVIRIIVRLRVVQDRNARLRQNIRNFIAHADHGIPLIQRPQRI